MATFGWTVAYAPYYAMGAELSMDYLERSNVTFCRELFTILGIVIASLLYSISFDFEYNIFRNGISSKEGLIQICIFSSFAFLFSMIFFLFGHKDKRSFK